MCFFKQRLDLLWENINLFYIIILYYYLHIFTKDPNKEKQWEDTSGNRSLLTFNNIFIQKNPKFCTYLILFILEKNTQKFSVHQVESKRSPSLTSDTSRHNRHIQSSGCHHLVCYIRDKSRSGFPTRPESDTQTTPQDLISILSASYKQVVFFILFHHLPK